MTFYIMGLYYMLSVEFDFGAHLSSYEIQIELNSFQK
jgi:hypothetical protein